ncbi:helix-turn-helix domain-containing protein [Streptomyces noursei]|uniref:helix-turn-helix domain-containing protein n=1 Tax=Streptomyces noursei TaxID=1971 RepID=UPI0033FF6766
MARPPKELDPTLSPAHLLGKKVQAARLARKWSQETLGGKVFCSAARIAQVELATDPPNRELCERLDEILELEGQLLELLPLLKHSSTFVSWAEVFLRRQAKAVKIHEFSQVVPGLLQTPGYARAMLTSGYLFNSDRDLESMIQDRLDRQDILRRDQPPWLWAILDESVLHHVVGGREAMREQLQHLLNIGLSERVHIQILPFDATVPAALAGSLSLLTMPGGEQVAYMEGLRGGSLLEGDDAIPYTVLYDRLHGNALSHDESAGLIRRVLEEKYE